MWRFDPWTIGKGGLIAMTRKLNRQSTWICCILSGILNSQQVFAQSPTQASGQQQVIDACTVAIVGNPRDTSAYFKRAQASYILGQYKKAINEYNKALIIDTKNSDAYSNLGQYKKAIDDFTRAISIDPRDWYAPRR